MRMQNLLGLPSSWLLSRCLFHPCGRFFPVTGRAGKAWPALKVEATLSLGPAEVPATGMCHGVYGRGEFESPSCVRDFCVDSRPLSHLLWIRLRPSRAPLGLSSSLPSVYLDFMLRFTAVIWDLLPIPSVPSSLAPAGLCVTTLPPLNMQNKKRKENMLQGFRGGCCPGAGDWGRQAGPGIRAGP